MGDLEERAAVRVSPSLSQISRQAMRRKPRGAPATIAPRERRPAAHPWPLGSTPGYVCRRVSWFCSLKGNEFFAEVEEDFIQDDFNLTGLSAQVPHYEFALDTILDVESPATAGFSEEQQVSPRRPHAAQACVPAAAACARYTRMRTCARHPHPHPHASTHTAAQESIESAAELLYGLIHARFIITPRGMSAMLDKYKNTHFGRCPRAFCQGQPVLPVGQSDVPRMHTSKVFCPKCSVRAPRAPPLPSTTTSPPLLLPPSQICRPRLRPHPLPCACPLREQDIYYPRSQRQANVDGAYFGTTFCHLFLQTYWDLVPPPPTTTYIPRIFGFKIHRTAKARLAAAAGRPTITSSTSAAAAPAAPGRRATATAPARTAK